MPCSILVLLRGCPADIPHVWGSPTGGAEEPVKILHGNGYEHFEFTQEYVDIGLGPMPVYRWSHRTFVAE
ncbi:DUF5988 family protein [Kitasatospora sp. NPDC050543]|uniref:DUF5988 family protein n=1 Tax=Kitasatospora sp. NPDC050543 TaxID=3364054 RepID=UPI0037B44D92